MFNRFGNIGDWTSERILLVYSFALTSYGAAKTLFCGFENFPFHMLRTGDFDRLLLRPVSLFTQVSASVFNFHRAANFVAGLIIMAISLHRLHTEISFVNLAMIMSALLGGILLYTGVFILGAGIGFFTINALDWVFIFNHNSVELARIPVDHMPVFLRKTFTFLMPMLVISYFPSAAISWGGSFWRGWLALPVGAAFFNVSLVFWKIGVKRYKSTGS